MGERNIIKHIKFLFLLIIIGSVLIYVSYMQGLFEKISLEKQELTVTRVLRFDELVRISDNQRELSKDVMSETKRNHWLAKEISEGRRNIVPYLVYMNEHPNDLIEIRFTTTKYIDEGNVIEFISDEGVITKVHSENGWISLQTN